MLKHKYTITFDVDIQYPFVDTKQDIKSLEADFDALLKDWVMNQSMKSAAITPTLHDPQKGGAVKHQPNAMVGVKIVRDKEIILNTYWEEHSDDF